MNLSDTLTTLLPFGVVCAASGTIGYVIGSMKVAGLLRELHAINHAYNALQSSVSILRQHALDAEARCDFMRAQMDKRRKALSEAGRRGAEIANARKAEARTATTKTTMDALSTTTLRPRSEVVADVPQQRAKNKQLESGAGVAAKTGG